MGLFGGGNEPNNEANDLIEQQMRENEIQIEQKRRSLYQTRLEVIKAQGAQQWVTPATNAGYKPAGGMGGQDAFTQFARGQAKAIKAQARSLSGRQ